MPLDPSAFAAAAGAFGCDLMLPAFGLTARPLGVLSWPPIGGRAEVPWWEVGLALALLIAAILGVRRLAGKVFRLGMLMYGKEPSWSEVRRWLREA
jgi:hypothetical protein